MNKKKQNGITLIALVITIIVLLILAGVAIATLSGDNSAPQKATEAAQKDAIAGAKDEVAMEVQEALLTYYNGKYVVGDGTAAKTLVETVQDAADTAVRNAKSRNKELLETSGVSGNTITLNTKSYTVTGTIEANGGITWSDSNASGGSGNGQGGDHQGGDDPAPSTASKVTIDGTDVDLSALTASTVKQYYGKTVATVNDVQYGLFYVDYEGKYGDEGTVYLRAKSKIADTALNGGIASSTDKTEAINIMKSINPDWAKTTARGNADYDTDYTPAEKGASFLCNPNNSTWSSIKTGFETLCNKNEGDDYVNYVIGAPSVEMFLDSYNAKYNTTTYSAHFKAAGEKYTYPGYLYSNDGGTNNFETYYSGAIQEDTTAGVMYRNTSKSQWLASPLSGSIDDHVCNVYSDGHLSSNNWSSSYGVAPLVSLKSGVDLTTTN